MPVETPDQTPLMPYQYPNPPDALPEIVVPHAIPQDERSGCRRPRTWFRPLCRTPAKAIG